MEKQKAAEMFDLIVKNGELPAKLEQLVPLSFIGQAAVGFYREKVKLMDKLNVAEEQREATLKDGQNAGKMLLDIESRIGELVAKTEQPRQSSGTYGQKLPMGIDWNRSRKAQAIYRNPSAVAEVIEEAEKNEDIPTRTAVLKHIALKKLKNKELKREKKLPDINEAARDVYDKLTECLSKLVKIWENKENLSNYNKESIHDVIIELFNLVQED